MGEQAKRKKDKAESISGAIQKPHVHEQLLRLKHFLVAKRFVFEMA